MGVPAVHRARIGKYRIVGVLGEGSMGIVYRAHDPVIDREVAVKTIRTELLSSDMADLMLDRFRREAMAAGRLQHHGIIAVYDCGEDAGTAYIVMEYAPGIGLNRYVRAQRLELPHVASIMAQLLDALGYAHARGVVHRDIKPSNLLLLPDGRLKVTDFGIARIQAAELATTNARIGTPSYMAPEQYTGAPLDHRADLFAAGVTFYQLLTGRLPFTAQSAEALGYQIVTTPHLPPSVREPSLGTRFDGVLRRALAKNPAQRHGSAAEMAHEVSLAMEGDASAEASIPITFDVDLETEQTLGTPPLLSAETLDRLASALKEVLGPMATAIVRRAASRARSSDELLETLARKAPESDRARVTALTQQVLSPGPVSSRQGSDSRGTPHRSEVFTSAPPSSRFSSGPASGQVLSASEIERIAAELARFVGPIARVLVKKAAPNATDARALCMLLAEHVEREEDRAAFLRAAAR